MSVFFIHLFIFFNTSTRKGKSFPPLLVSVFVRNVRDLLLVQEEGRKSVRVEGRERKKIHMGREKESINERKKVSRKEKKGERKSINP